MKVMDFKVFQKKGKYVIKTNDGDLIKYDGKTIFFNSLSKAVAMADAIYKGDKHAIVGMDFMYSKLNYKIN